MSKLIIIISIITFIIIMMMMLLLLLLSAVMCFGVGREHQQLRRAGADVSADVSGARTSQDHPHPHPRSAHVQRE